MSDFLSQPISPANMSVMERQVADILGPEVLTGIAGEMEREQGCKENEKVKEKKGSKAVRRGALQKRINEKIKKIKKEKKQEKTSIDTLVKKCIQANHLATQLTLMLKELRALTRSTQKLIQGM